jgi:hypothetical protein
LKADLASNEFIIDGEQVNKLLETFQLKHEMLPGQVFDIVEKKLIKSLADEIDKAKPQTVRLINLEAITSGPHKDFLYAICGGLVELIDSLTEKGTAVSGVVDGSQILPWNLMYRLDKQFKEPAESVPRKAQ